MMEWPVIAIKVDNNPVPVSLPVSLQKRVRHHHHGLVMSLIPGGGGIWKVYVVMNLLVGKATANSLM